MAFKVLHFPLFSAIFLYIYTNRPWPFTPLPLPGLSLLRVFFLCSCSREVTTSPSRSDSKIISLKTSPEFSLENRNCCVLFWIVEPLLLFLSFDHLILSDFVYFCPPKERNLISWSFYLRHPLGCFRQKPWVEGTKDSITNT